MKINSINSLIINLWKGKKDLIEKQYKEILQKEKLKKRNQKEGNEKKIQEKIKRKILIPEIFPEKSENCSYLLFVGLNPSDSLDVGRTVREKQKKYPKIDENYNLEWPDKDEVDIEKIKYYWKIIREHYKKYYSPITTFFRKMNLEGFGDYYSDLYFFRETDSKIFNNFLKDKELKDFWRTQLEIFRKIIDYIQPKIIIVVNETASKIIKKEGYRKESIIGNITFDKEKHCYYLEYENKKTLLFFISIGNGHPAEESGEILKYHIKKTFYKIREEESNR